MLGETTRFASLAKTEGQYVDRNGLRIHHVLAESDTIFKRGNKITGRQLLVEHFFDPLADFVGSLRGILGQAHVAQVPVQRRDGHLSSPTTLTTQC